MQAALLQAMIILGLALLCLYLHRRYHKPYFAWWALAWFLYFFRLGAISFITGGGGGALTAKTAIGAAN